MDSPLIENNSVAVNGVDIAMTTAVPVACVGGGGVGVVAGKLGGSGTVRSRSLSPVRNSLTQTVPAFKQDGVGAVDSRTGDMLLTSTNGGGGGWQGARPKAYNYSSSNSSSSNSSSNIILSPVLGSRDAPGSGGISNCNRRTSSNVSSTCAASKVNGSTAYNSSSSYDGHINQTSNSSPKYGNAASTRSNTNNSRCSNNPLTQPAPHPASTQYAISTCSPSHTTVCGTSRPQSFLSASLPDNASVVSSKQDSSLSEQSQVRTNSSRSDRACFRGGLDLVSMGVIPAQAGNLDSASCSNMSKTNNTQHHGNSSPSGRWADPAAEAVHLLLEDPTSSLVGQSPREDCGNKSPQGQHPLSLQSTLVADCSPTAPYNSDIHRRLYLAQHSFLPDSGAPISPSGCPSCLPPNMCFRDDMSTSQCMDSLNGRVPAHVHGTLAFSQLPDSVMQNNLKNSSPPLACHPFRKSLFLSSGSPQQHTNPDTTPALSGEGDGSLQKVQETQYSCQNIVSGNNEKLKHLESVSASTFISSTSACLPSVLSSSPPRVSNHARALEAFPASDHLSTPQHPGCWISHTDSQQGDDNTRPFISHGAPGNSSSLDKLALILSEEPSAQLSSHNFRSMPGFVMRNPDLPIIDTSNSDSNINDDDDHHHNLVDYDVVGANCNSFMSPPPSPPPTLQGGNHLSSELDIQIQATSASLPSSPIRFGRRGQYAGDTNAAHEDVLKGRCKHLSPLLGRKGLPPTHSHSSSRSHSQDLLGLEELRLSQQYESLEMFQKAQLRQKVSSTHANNFPHFAFIS